MFFKKFSVILGPITYINPFRTVTDKDGKEVAQKESLSLADVPISFDLFRLWWMKTVIKPGLKSMTLKQFIEAIVTKLIAPAIGPDAFGEAGKSNIGAARGLPSITLFNYPSPNKKITLRPIVGVICFFLPNPRTLFRNGGVRRSRVKNK